MNEWYFIIQSCDCFYNILNIQLKKDSVIQLLNNKLNKNLKEEDIEYVQKLKNLTEGKPNRLRIAFTDKKTKIDIFKQRTKLKDIDDQDIWIADDLTKMRGEVAYATRQAVRNNKANMTYVYVSKVFNKIKATDRPKVVRCKKDVPN